jgi:hypothetical protein
MYEFKKYASWHAICPIKVITKYSGQGGDKTERQFGLKSMKREGKKLLGGLL